MNLTDYKKEYEERFNDLGVFREDLTPLESRAMDVVEVWNFIESMVKDILASVELESMRDVIIKTDGIKGYNQAVAEQRKKHEEVLE